MFIVIIRKRLELNSSIGLLATEGTLNTGVYNKFFDKNYNLIFPNISLQKNSVNKAIKFVKILFGKLNSNAEFDGFFDINMPDVQEVINLGQMQT